MRGDSAKLTRKRSGANFDSAILCKIDSQSKYFFVALHFRIVIVEKLLKKRSVLSVPHLYFASSASKVSCKWLLTVGFLNVIFEV
jgi:hypothetical protein